MRVLVATDQWFPDRMGGVARVVSETSRRLAERGHSVHVLAPESRTAPRRVVEGELVVERVLPRSLVPTSITDAVATYRTARRRRKGYDVAVAHVSSVCTGLVAGDLGAPLAFVYHASALRELQFRRARMPWTSVDRLAAYPLQPLLSAFEQASVRKATTLLVLSEFSRRLLEADHGGIVDGRIVNVSAGVDLDAFAPGDGVAAARSRLGIRPDGLPLLVTVRRLESRMGLEQLIRAVKHLDSLRPVNLTIVGTGSLARSLEALVCDLDLRARVTLRGKVDDAELGDWYRAADLFVLPTVAYEGFGLVTAEALASGTPVVGTRIGATPELLEPLDQRLLATGTEPDELAAAIRRALTLVGPSFGERCRRYACSRFDWDAAIVSWERALLATAGGATDTGSKRSGGRKRGST